MLVRTRLYSCDKILIQILVQRGIKCPTPDHGWCPKIVEVYPNEVGDVLINCLLLIKLVIGHFGPFITPEVSVPGQYHSIAMPCLEGYHSRTIFRPELGQI